MSFKTKPRLGRKINPYHPLSRGLIGCWLFNEKTGEIANNIASPLNITLGTAGDADWGWQTGKQGKVVEGNVVQGDAGNDPIFDIRDHTFVAMIKKNVMGEHFPIAGKGLVSPNGNYAYGIWSRGAGFGADDELYWYQNITGHNNAVSGIALSVLYKWYFVGVAVENDTDVLRYIVDGQTSQKSKTGSIQTNSYDFNLGSEESAYDFNGGISYLYFWNRALSFSELQRLYIDPYCFLEPIIQTDYFFMPPPKLSDGEDLSGTFTDDIQGRTRAIWYIGASELTIPVGSVCWGHVTGVTQDNTRTFVTNWTGTGTISGSGDAEIVELAEGQYVESEVINIEAGLKEINLDDYQSGSGAVIVKYKDGSSVANCEADTWNTYSVPYTSEGYSQIRLER